jgi:hypothetical protein
MAQEIAPVSLSAPRGEVDIAVRDGGWGRSANMVLHIAPSRPRPSSREERAADLPAKGRQEEISNLFSKMNEHALNIFRRLPHQTTNKKFQIGEYQSFNPHQRDAAKNSRGLREKSSLLLQRHAG